MAANGVRHISVFRKRDQIADLHPIHQRHCISDRRPWVLNEIVKDSVAAHPLSICCDAAENVFGHGTHGCDRLDLLLSDSGIIRNALTNESIWIAYKNISGLAVALLCQSHPIFY